MKLVILAGGRGTRLSEETQMRPKPMVEIGGYPMIWHIMKLYSHYGVNDFVICLGYLGNYIKDYFVNYFLYNSDVTIDLSQNSIQYHSNRAEPWRITLVDTGLDTLTAGRLKRVRHYVEGETFCLTYGDGLGDLDIAGLIAFHRRCGRQATMTVVRPPARFGSAKIEDDHVVSFLEKPQAEEGLINGGFFVLESGIFNYIGGDDDSWELQPLQGLAADGALSAYRHDGFWQAMDTLRDRTHLNTLWQSGEAPWKVWK